MLSASMTAPRTARLLIAALWSLCLGAAACGSSDVGPGSHDVGGRCMVDTQCDKRCLTGNSFPGGYCTRTCVTDKDCPSGAACVTQMGGVCMGTCHVPADCNGYGAGYQCNRLARQGGGEGALVCIGPTSMP